MVESTVEATKRKRYERYQRQHASTYKMCMPALTDQNSTAVWVCPKCGGWYDQVRSNRYVCISCKSVIVLEKAVNEEPITNA